jgi:hypothetical protein
LGSLSSSAPTVPMLGLTVSTTTRNDVALIGIVLLACGIAALATGVGLAERLTLVGGLWGAAALVFAAARRA